MVKMTKVKQKYETYTVEISDFLKALGFKKDTRLIGLNLDDIKLDGSEDTVEITIRS